MLSIFSVESDMMHQGEPVWLAIPDRHQKSVNVPVLAAILACNRKLRNPGLLA
jgi:hypothetical protein